jgi:hypothetical protein
MCKKLTMSTINKWFVASLVIFAGEIATINPGNAQAAFDHDTTSVPTTQSLVDTGVPANSINGFINPNTGAFTIEGLGGGAGEITIPSDVIQSLNDLIGSGGNILGADSSNTITICFSDPCIPSGESSKAITVNELADLIEDDLQQSLNDLAAAEDLDDNQPRRFVRRRSSDCINPAIQAREVVQAKLEESRQFIEQIEQLNPDNNIW